MYKNLIYFRKHLLCYYKYLAINYKITRATSLVMSEITKGKDCNDRRGVCKTLK